LPDEALDPTNLAILFNMPSPKALITGINGQDGAYLAYSLLNSGYEVFGTSGSTAKSKNWRLKALEIADNEFLTLLDWDITDANQTQSLLAELKPDEIYNLASHSFVGDSLFEPQVTTLVSGFAPVSIMDALATSCPSARFFQAGSSEMFGNATSSPQNEDSGFFPRNIYGTAKVLAHSATVNYRQTGGLFTASGILYNHESPLRGSEFVTKKITSTVAKVTLNQVDHLRIGNLSSLRDWGYAPEYVEAMRLIVGYQTPETFVISSGVATSVRDFVKAAFNALDIDISFEGSGLLEVGYEISSGRKLVSVEKEFYRESEKVTLVGDSEKARKLLGWKAQTSVQDIVGLMVRQDLEELKITKGK
jgi:GDPmannose 4,6-dehydratase